MGDQEATNTLFAKSLTKPYRVKCKLEAQGCKWD